GAATTRCGDNATMYGPRSMSAATNPGGKAASGSMLADRKQRLSEANDVKDVTLPVADRRKMPKPASSVAWLSNTITASWITGADNDTVPGNLTAQTASGSAESHAA